MKKQVLLFLISIISINLFAQHISEYYTFSEENINDYYYLIEYDGRISNINSDGGEMPNVSIGFDFEYAGTTYSTLTIGVNGAVTFTGTDVFGGNDLAGTATNVSDIIAPLWDDLYLRSAEGGEIRWKLYGDAPNRRFYVEWRNLSWWHLGSSVAFKLRLEEGTNDIEFTYGPLTTQETGGEIGASIGLNAGTSGNNFMSVTPGDPATINTISPNNSIMPAEYYNYVKYKKYIFKYGPHNDACEDAIEIGCGDALDGISVGATGTGETTCGLDASNKGVWYHFAPTNGGGVTSIWTTADFDTKLAVYSGSCTSLSCIANDDDTSGNQPYVEIETLPETDYYIYVVGYGTHTGEFTLYVECNPPVNDEASGAINIPVNAIGTICTNPTMLWNNNGVTDSSSTNGTPSCGNYVGGDSWYKFTAPASGGIKINKPNSGDWGYLGYAIYDSPTSTTPLVCNYIESSETTSVPYTGMSAGATYWLRVWEWDNNNFGSVGICLEEVDTAGYDDLVGYGFKYYPNPATDILYFSAQDNIEQICIYNMLGQEVKNSIPVSTNSSLDISDLQVGTYLMKVQIGTHTGMFKLIRNN